MKTLKEIVTKFGLEKHVEGGFYKRMYTSQTQVKRENRALSSAILYALAQDDFSGLHSLTPDETWYFHSGNPLKIFEIVSQSEIRETILGADYSKGHVPIYTVAGNTPFAVIPIGEEYDFSFVSCSVTPEFLFDDFELFSVDKVKTTYPSLFNQLARLCKR